MTLTQFRYIIAVHTHRHFADAAASCFVTQPTLSMQIRKLEDQLGVLIFDRSKHPIAPTPIGKEIIAQAQLAVREADRIQALVDSGKGEVAGDFRLGIIPTIASSLLPRFLKAAMSAYPKLRLHVEELQTSTIIERLSRDKLDAAILATPLNERGLEERPLYYEPFMAFIPEGHRLAEDEFILHTDLDINDILLLNEGHCFRNNVINICSNAFDNKLNQSVYLESGSFDTLVKLSEQGFGMTLVPYLVALDLRATGKGEFIKPFAAPKPTREVAMVYTKGQFKTQIIDALSGLIQSSVPDTLLEPEEATFVSSIH